MILRGKRAALLLFCALILFVLTTSTLLGGKAAALATLTSRSLTLEAGATDGGSKPGGTVKYLFAFTTATTANIGSIDFQFCSTAGGSCTPPTGLDVHSATLNNQSPAMGFTLSTPTVSNNEMYVTRSAVSLAASTAVTFEFGTVVNPTAANSSFYVHITTYTSANVTTGATDNGTVAASTANPVVLTGTMPESLIFCTGAAITNNGGGIPDCSTATSSSNIQFNQLFSPADTATAVSQMAASTNADSGYAITYTGATLTSGSNTVAPMSATFTPTRGKSQFGLNLVANTTTTSTPAVGTAIYPTSNGTNLKGLPAAAYNTADSFKFLVAGDTAASSNSSGAGPSDIQTYTVSYMVNVNGAQAVGTYTTTLTYICTPTY